MATWTENGSSILSENIVLEHETSINKIQDLIETNFDSQMSIKYVQVQQGMKS